MMFRASELVLGCLLTVAASSVVMLFFSGTSWLDKEAGGFFTFILAIVAVLQAALFLVQLKLIRESLTPAAEAADAAKLNAQAVIDAERAYLFVFIASDVVDAMKKAAEYDETSPAKFRFQLIYSFKNYGRTPAIIRQINHGTCIAPELPRERTYSAVVHLPTHLLPVNEATSTVTVDDAPMITGAIAKSIRDIENTFWFYGDITYDDMFGWRRTFSFVWHYSAVSNGFNLYSWNEVRERRAS